MPTRPFHEISARNRVAWSADAVDLAERLATHFEAEVGAQQALGCQIAAARQAAQLTQPQLATLAGVQQGDISRIERGGGNPTRDTLLKLANALGMELVLRPKEPGPVSTSESR